MALAVILAVCVAPAARAEVAHWEPARTHAVIVGVLTWKNPAYTRYSAKNRKDQKLYETLLARGVRKENMELILDQEATLARIRTSLERVASRARPGDTFIFYYAGHGVLTSKGVCFLNYDAGEVESFSMVELAALLKKHFRGERVMTFADCCFSGGLQHAMKLLADEGYKTACITSVTPVYTSTNNWTFTHALIDVFRGRATADRDQDRYVTLAEAAGEISDAMKHREGQESGYSRNKLPEPFRLGKANERPAMAVPSPFKPYQYVLLSRSGRRQPARIIGGDRETVTVEIQRYSTRDLVKAKPEQIQVAPKVLTNPRTGFDKPTKVLADDEALRKAAVDGKYTQLLKKIRVEQDYRSYSEFNDYGSYPATSYAGHTELPAGYWVYVYPHWYIWKTKAAPKREKP